MVHGEDAGEVPLLTVREVAKQLNVCASTVYELTRRGTLRHLRILNAIRVPPTALAEFLAAEASGASPNGSSPPTPPVGPSNDES